MNTGSKGSKNCSSVRRDWIMSPELQERISTRLTKLSRRLIMTNWEANNSWTRKRICLTRDLPSDDRLNSKNEPCLKRSKRWRKRVTSANMTLKFWVSSTKRMKKMRKQSKMKCPKNNKDLEMFRQSTWAKLMILGTKAFNRLVCR